MKQNRIYSLVIILVISASLLAACSSPASVPTMIPANTQPPAPTTIPTTAPTFTTAPTSAPTNTPVPTVAPTATPDPKPKRVGMFKIPAPSLANNLIGESTQRELIVYTPPSYNSSDKRFPVIYYLPGYGDSMMIGVTPPTDIDKLITDGAIREMIIVIASGANQFGGSFYANSPVTGNWEDFIVKDVVQYIDSHYRTISQAEARGITGHSMGGYGALDIAMKHPDVFSAVYSMSPGLFDENGLAESQLFASQYAIDGYLAYEKKVEAMPADEAINAQLGSGGDGFTVGYGMAFAPNPNKHAPFIDYPYVEKDGKLVQDAAIWKRWESGFGGIKEEIAQYKSNLMSLKGLVVDYGTMDSYAWIPKGCVYFDAQLKAAGIPHTVESFEGGHQNLLGQRITEKMLPFFSNLLQFE